MILMIDNYDSFTYNLVDYFGQWVGDKIKVYRNDKISLDQIETMSPEAIIISPGPKTPTEAGISKDIIKKFGSKTPIFGVCLGHQAIGEVFGCKVIRAKHLMHGKTSQVTYSRNPLFKNLPNPFTATRYHSLTLDTESISNQIKVIAYSDDDQEIMAIQHKHYPIYGVQFHPESICTPEGLQLIKNFLEIYKII